MSFSSILLALAFLFFFGSVVGWVIELFFRRLFGDKKWINPGFLKGPYLPIYGFGLCAMFLLCRINLSFLPWKWLQVVALLLIICVAMTAIEYVAGIIFIKGMKIKLWDYSRQWRNIQGIICPLFSLLWTAVGAFYYFALDSFFYNSVVWLFDNLAYCFFIGFFFGIFAVDLVHSTGIAVKLRAFATEHNVVLQYEHLKGSVQEYMQEIKEKTNFLVPFRISKMTMREFLEKYIKKEDNPSNASDKAGKADDKTRKN